MREHDLQLRRRRRYVATTDSAQDSPVFPNLAVGVVPGGRDELWVADITYIAVAAGFVSTYYDAPSANAGDAEVVARMREICDEFQTYDYRRVGAALRQQGIVVRGPGSRCLVRARRWLTRSDRPLHRHAADGGGAWTRPSGPGAPVSGASATPTVGRSTRPSTTARRLPNTASSAR